MADECVTEQMKDLQVEEKKSGKDGGKKKSKNAGGEAGGKAELSPPPQYIEERLSIYHKLKEEHDSLLAEKAAKGSKPINITLPDGKVVDGESWKTTPYQVACGISWIKSIFKRSLLDSRPSSEENANSSSLSRTI